MGMDNRDWYRDWWRKKTGYVERASFRVSSVQHSRDKYRHAWRRNFVAVAVFTLAVFAAVALLRFLRA